MRRHRRGDIKFALLELLAERPRHGYELIKELENRYGGFYRPSPGTVYPTLQLLEDEGHVTSEVVEGKRIYTITDSGRALLAGRQEPEEHGRWERGFRRGPVPPEAFELRNGMMGLGAAVVQIALHGTPEQIQAVSARLDALRREIHGLLAQGGEQPPPSEA
jgi:DNA-binding PadR family transcriptional regulator